MHHIPRAYYLDSATYMGFHLTLISMLKSRQEVLPNHSLYSQMKSYLYCVLQKFWTSSRKSLHLIFTGLLKSDQISCSVVSDSLWPHESQHARPPCPSPTPRIHWDSRPLSQWCHPAISSSVVPSPLAPSPSQHQSLFQ